MMMIPKISNYKDIYIFKFIGLLLLLLCFENIPIEIFNLDTENWSKTIKIIYLLVCDITLLGIFIFIYRKSLLNDFKLFKKDFINNFEYAFKYWFIGFIIMIISNLLIVNLFPTSIAGNEEAVRSLIDKAPLYMLFSVAIYAPLTEELIFRKSIKDFINNKYIYVFVSGFIFGSLHVIGSVETAIDLVYLVPYCALGFTFALLYYNSKNIFSSISMHALHNTLTIILYFIGASI